MSEAQTEIRAKVVVDGEPVLLARAEDVEHLKRRFEAAVATGGTFVDLPAAGDRTVSVLATPGTRVVITVFTVAVGEGEAADDDESFATPFEFAHDLG